MSARTGPALCTLDGGEAVAAATAVGCSPELATVYAEAGCVAALGDAAVVVGATPDPLLGTLDAYVPAASPSLLGEAGRLAAAVTAHLPGADRVVVRTPAGVALPDGRLLVRYLDADLGRLALGPPCDRCVVGPAGAGDAGFVLDRLAAALVRGYGHAGWDVDAGAARRHVEAAFPDLSGAGGTAALVVRHDGERVGHLTYRLDEPDDVTGDRATEVVDVDLGPLTGHTRCAVAALRDRVAPDHAAVRGNVVVTADGTSEAILDRLLAQGWTPGHDLWLAWRRPGP